jgi:hypothetical protein
MGLKNRVGWLSSNSKGFVFVMLGLFILLESASVWQHEPWRDEMAVWMLAKYNPVQCILGEARIQAQPSIWYFVVKGMQEVIPGPLSMGIANLLFITLAAWLILQYGPFSGMAKSCLCFSYFIFYEYGTISRNYGMTVAILFSVCALHKQRKRYWMLMALLLAIGCSVQIMNVVFAGCFLLVMVAEEFHWLESGEAGRAKRLSTSALIIVAGMLAAFWQASPPVGSPWATSSDQKWVFHSGLGAMKSIWMAFVPLAEPTLHFWNTNILPDGRLMIAASFLILVFCTSLLIRRPIAVLFYLSGTIALLLFFEHVYHGFTRHHGYLLLVFVASYWIFQNYGERAAGKVAGSFASRGNRNWNCFTILCFVNFSAVFVPVYMDWQYPFSASREVGRFLSDHRLENCLLLGDAGFSVAPVAGWIDRDIFYPATGEFSKMIDWRRSGRERGVAAEVNIDTDRHQRIWQAATTLAAEKKRNVLLILNYPIDREPIREFPISIVPDESYHLYCAEVQAKTPRGRCF